MKGGHNCRTCGKGAKPKKNEKKKKANNEGEGVRPTKKARQVRETGQGLHLTDIDVECDFERDVTGDVQVDGVNGSGDGVTGGANGANDGTNDANDGDNVAEGINVIGENDILDSSFWGEAVITASIYDSQKNQPTQTSVKR